MNDADASKPAPPATARSWTDLGPRVISGLVLVFVTAAALWVGGYVYAAIIGLVFAGAYREWENMVTLAPLTGAGIGFMAALAVSALVYPAFGPFLTLAVVAAAAAVALALGSSPAWWRAGGLLFFGIVIVAALSLRGTTDAGVLASVLVGTAVWATDTAAFFIGRQVGGEKLAPWISPGKTWSGAIGGLAVATVLASILWVVFTDSPLWIGVVIAAALSLLSQVGDLAESWVKRRFRIKDSGDIIPGHGGLMDRLDSITFGVIAAAVLGLLHSGFGAPAAGLLFW